MQIIAIYCTGCEAKNNEYFCKVFLICKGYVLSPGPKNSLLTHLTCQVWLTVENKLNQKSDTSLLTVAQLTLFFTDFGRLHDVTSPQLQLF